MSFRNEWMMNMFLSLDRMKQGDNAEKWSVLSDGGRGADAIRNSLDQKEIHGVSAMVSAPWPLGIIAYSLTLCLRFGRGGLCA